MKMDDFRKIYSVDVKVAEGIHPLEEKYGPQIARYWQEQKEANDALYNGEFFLTVDCQIGSGRLRALYKRTDFATFLYWLRHTTDVKNVFHIFSVAAMVTSDDKILMGKMAEHTANAGRVYIPAGSISDEDIVDGQADFDGCMLRETMEETGIVLGSSMAQSHLTLIEKKGVIALIREYYVDVSANVLLDRVRSNLPNLKEQELQSVEAYGPGEIHPTMPEFLKDYQISRMKKEEM